MQSPRKSKENEKNSRKEKSKLTNSLSEKKNASGAIALNV